MIVGYCASCAHLKRYAIERPVRGLARFGRCQLGVRPIGGALGLCDRWREKDCTIPLDRRCGREYIVRVPQKPATIIATKRAALGLTQAQAADLAGISTRTWKIIEEGVIENPTLNTARGIARALRCSLADIWTWAVKSIKHVA